MDEQAKRNRRTYSDEFERYAVRLVVDEGCELPDDQDQDDSVPFFLGSSDESVGGKGVRRV